MITALCLSVCCLGFAHECSGWSPKDTFYITQCCVMGEIAKIAHEEGQYVCMACCHAAYSFGSQGLYK